MGNTNSAQKRKRDESPETVQKFATGIPSLVRNVEWSLKNFKTLVHNKDSIDSLKLNFDVENTIDMPSKWCLYFKLNPTNRNSIGLYLKYTDQAPEGTEEVFVNYKILINSGVGGKETRMGPHFSNFKTSTWGWGRHEVFSHEALMATASDLLPNGTLSIKLRMEMFGNVAPSTTNLTDSKKPRRMLIQTPSQAAVVDDMSKLFESETNTDLVIQTKDLKLFHVHRLILAARSTVFRAMFQTEMTENTTGLLEIGDISSKAMGFLLKFMYSGGLESGWAEVIDEIIYAADKYNLPSLTEFCDQGLIDAVTVENAMNLLLLAKRHGLVTATADITGFIRENFESVLESFPDGVSVPEAVATNMNDPDL